ncbi:IclR family transcriptional regulator C-terminal domain-containing protein [soil metagenome]
MSSQDKMLSLLDVFSVEHPVWSTDELIAHTGLPPSTCYRYIKSLHDAGLLARVGSGSYVIGPRVLAMDRISRSSDPVYRVGTPVIRRLTETTGFSSLLSVLYSDSVMCVQQEAAKPVPEGLFGRGQQRPLFAGATANIILAYLPTHQLKSVWTRHSSAITSTGLGDDWDAFRANLRVFQNQGYALSLGEYRPGIAGIAAPLFNRDRAVLGSIAIATSTRSRRLKEFKAAVDEVMAAAAEISTGISTAADAVDLPARAMG